jgi:hypothetical protein
MLVCGCFFAVSAKNAEAGPLGNFVFFYGKQVGLEEKDRIAIIDGERTSLKNKKIVTQPGIFLAFSKFCSAVIKNSTSLPNHSDLHPEEVRSLVKSIKGEASLSGDRFIWRMDFFKCYADSNDSFYASLKSEGEE